MTFVSGSDQLNVLIGLVKKIGNVDFNRFSSSFKQRLIMQKTTYFLKVFGIPFEYPFTWYLHGPYSPQLAKAMFDSLTPLEKVSEIELINEQFVKAFENVEQLLGERKHDAQWIEALASLHFQQRLEKKSKEEVFAAVLRKQPTLTEDECEKAWDHL